MTSFQVKVLQKKFTLLHAHFSKIVLKYSNEVHLGPVHMGKSYPG